MPVLLPVDQLESGMTLAEAFTFQGRLMLPRGKELSGSDISTLSRRFPTAHIKVGHPILDEFVQFEDDSYERDVARTAQTHVSRSVENVERRLSDRASLSPSDFQAMQKSAHDVMRYIGENRVSAALLCRTLESGSYLADHTSAVFYLALTLGTAVQGYVAKERVRQTHARELDHNVAYDLSPLGLGAMFMDIGMFELRSSFEDTNGELSDEQRKELREHTNTGADMLPESFPPSARMVVRTHHENYDGSGYPKGMLGARQHVFTRIVRICDSYDAGTSMQDHKEKKSSARVLWEMLKGPYRELYDPFLMGKFAGLIQPFPIGARLQLVDGRFVVVVKYNRLDSFQPWVVISYDRSGEPLPANSMGKPVKLGSRENLRVAFHDDEDVSYIYEPCDEEFDADILRLVESAYP